MQGGLHIVLQRILEPQDADERAVDRQIERGEPVEIVFELLDERAGNLHVLVFHDEVARSDDDALAAER